ncbi:MAG: hypothetical protein H6Q41_1794 [Deltaproteobacteria bacterium]|jgi:uncharacterized protein with HEPN domain|nr:hypothetical protein [Deltaproteobacteria bacterium]
MSNHEIIESLDWITECIGLIRERFAKIRVPDDFVLTPEGITLLDAISMRLQVIGETVKQIQKTNPAFLQSDASIDWDKIVRFRDLVSHHYEHIDHEIVFDICHTHIPKLGEVIRSMRMALSQNGIFPSQ